MMREEVQRLARSQSARLTEVMESLPPAMGCGPTEEQVDSARASVGAAVTIIETSPTGVTETQGDALARLLRDALTDLAGWDAA